MHPAIGAHATCEDFAASISTYEDLRPPAAEPPAAPVGDLAAVDPCVFIPGDLRGAVDATGPVQPMSPFGVAAPSCVLEWRHSMTTGRAERVLWLYPQSVSEQEAGAMARWIFGSAMPSSFRGAPVWLNHCAAQQELWLECRWAVAGLADGRFFVLDVSDPSATVDGVVLELARILAASS